MRRPRLLLPACAAALALAGAGCGDERENRSLLTEQAAESLREDLDQLNEAVEEGDCERVEEELASLNETIGNLSGSTSRRLRARLQQGVSELAARATDECAENRDTQTTETQPETTPPETTAPEPPVTTPPQTTPPQTTPPQTTPQTTTPQQPEGGGDDGGGGIPAPEGVVVPQEGDG